MALNLKMDTREDGFENEPLLVPVYGECRRNIHNLHKTDTTYFKMTYFISEKYYLFSAVGC